MDTGHAIAPLQILGDKARAWAGLIALLEETPRVRVVTIRERYLHAEFTTRLMHYVDDVEFLVLDTADDEIAIRSASRVGYGDMGTNRARVEWIRAALSRRGYVEAAP